MGEKKNHSYSSFVIYQIRKFGEIIMTMMLKYIGRLTTTMSEIPEGASNTTMVVTFNFKQDQLGNIDIEREFMNSNAFFFFRVSKLTLQSKKNNGR